MRTDVVVIGAGVAGLAAAREAERLGRTVVVLEARAAVGGRVRTVQGSDGRPVELGAQVVHGRGNPVRDLVATVDAPAPGAVAALLGGVTAPLGLLSRGGRPPWEVVRRLVADGGGADGTVADWLAGRGLRGHSARLTHEWFAQHWAAGTDRLGAEAVARSERGEDVGVGEFDVVGGFATLPQTLAAGLDVRCGVVVRRVRWAHGAVEVTTADGAVVQAAAAVLALPPAVAVGPAATLDLPDLDVRHHAAGERLPAGDAVVATLTLDAVAPTTATVLDVDGHWGFVRAHAGSADVTVVAKAHAAGRVRDALRGLRRGDAVPVGIAHALPWTGSCTVQRSRVADWGLDPWSGGGFVLAGPGSVRAAAEWRRPPAPHVAVAGEATELGRGLPWVHSALRSGRRAVADLSMEVAA